MNIRCHSQLASRISTVAVSQIALQTPDLEASSESRTTNGLNCAYLKGELGMERNYSNTAPGSLRCASRDK
ncbi:hypothetical protein HWI79_1973 [Cryptosporidium felis]|nr:hypothetical protein HWI79_1973 [Cryptosporidium felis]